jgi:hypothetical protein
MTLDPESARLAEARTAKTLWRKWGPYLSERQWGIVREDYSQDGNAWDYRTPTFKTWPPSSRIISSGSRRR